MEKIDLQFSTDQWFTDHQINRYTHLAMATIFEIYIAGLDKDYFAQAAQAAFRILDRLEEELSRFIENSDISRINQLKKGQSTIIGPDCFACLQACREIYDDTGGAFDISAGPLISLWKEKEKYDRKTFSELINQETARMGMEKLEMDRHSHSVTLLTDKIKLDLGGFGKGYALDRMAEILTDWNVDKVLLHGGRSTVLALESPDGLKGWPLTISDPHNPEILVEERWLTHSALSGSGLQKGCHIINPISGKPVTDRIATWSDAGSGALSDALSTAFMIMPFDDIMEYIGTHEGSSGMVIAAGEGRKIHRWPDGR